MAKLTVKAYLETGNEQQIRRFLLELNDATSFAHLANKIQAIFPDLANKKYTLSWKDEEGDVITFSSDEELAEGLSFVDNSLFKIYIIACGNERATAKEGPVHANVVCDGCEGPVVGTRFKCMICHDFDFCADCDAKGFHPDHDVVMIRTPKPFMRFPRMWGGFARGGRCRGRRNQCPCNEEERKECDEKETANENENMETNGGEGNPAETFLQNIGDTVAAMLDPLGIDVDVDVDSSGGRRHHRRHPHGHHGRGRSFGGRGSSPGKGGCKGRFKYQAKNGDAANSDATTKKSDAAPRHEDENELNAEKAADGDQRSTDEAMDSSQNTPNQNDTIPNPAGANLYPVTSLRVAEALEQMKAMGFSDAGGWLGRIIEANHGDICKVLDTLQGRLGTQPPQQQQPQ